MKTATKVALGGIAAGALVAGSAAGLGLVAASRIARRLRSGDSENLRGQTVLITGGSRGLGLALAEEFARLGCRIVMCARDELELLRARQQVERLGTEVVAVRCDVSRQDEVEHLVQVARQHFGRIDILVNDAGIISVGPLLSQRLEDYREAMDVIFWGTVHPTLAVLPEMLARGRGRIVNITSIGGKVSVPHLVPYGCAKFASVGFSEGLHAELKRYGINVLTVVPGLMRTGSHLNAFFKGQHQYEYGWFALSGTNPLLSISAERAARKIVDATRENRAELILSWQAKLLARVHGVAPGMTSEALALVNRLLPAAHDGSGQKRLGSESQSVITRSPLTALGKRAARRYNQLGRAA
jgi:short-subunit dehydrogenase